MDTIDTVLADKTPGPVRMAQLKASLEEKLGTITRLDSEILDLTEDDGLEDEIQEADEFKVRVYAGP